METMCLFSQTRKADQRLLCLLSCSSWDLRWSADNRCSWKRSLIPSLDAFVGILICFSRSFWARLTSLSRPRSRAMLWSWYLECFISGRCCFLGIGSASESLLEALLRLFFSFLSFFFRFSFSCILGHCVRLLSRQDSPVAIFNFAPSVAVPLVLLFCPWYYYVAPTKTSHPLSI